jgi:hypothetical protein
VVAQPLRRAETLAIFWFLCGPFAARGAKGEAEYPSRWLGGTGERSPVGKQERRGAGATRSAGRQSNGGAIRHRYAFHLVVEGMVYHDVVEFSGIDVIIFWCTVDVSLYHEVKKF